MRTAAGYPREMGRRDTMGVGMLLLEIDRCPCCARELDDRPPPNRCPDCGFEYDELTRVWRSNESWARLASRYAVVGLITGTAVSALYRASFTPAPYPALPLALALLWPAVGLLLRRLISGRISDRFVALTPQGIVVGTRRDPLVVPWDEFEELKEERGVPKLRQRHSATLIALEDIFASAAELAGFKTALMQATQRYQRWPVS